MDEQARRIGENEALFRRVNNQVEEIGEARGGVAQALDFVCECGDRECIERVTMDKSEYEALRSDPTHFAIKAGHDIPPVEEVIQKNERYWVVRKHEGPAAELARKLDEEDP